MTDAFEYDPERALWKPGRRAFFFGLGAALVAPMLPEIAQPAVKVVTEMVVTPFSLDRVYFTRYWYVDSKTGECMEIPLDSWHRPGWKA